MPKPAPRPRLAVSTTHRRRVFVSAVAALLLVGGLGATPLSAAEPPTEDRDGSTRASAAAGPSPWPIPPGIKGLDVSHWNGYPDLGKLRKKGMRFVFSKATQGTSFVDDTYKRHTREARAAAILPGAYHFFDYNKGGIAQAKHFLDTLRASTGLGSLLPLVVDVETLGSLGTPNKALARQRLHALLDELYRQTGRYPMIYTSRLMWEKVVGSPASFGKYPLWVACWKCDEVHLPNGWRDWDFWQVGQYRFVDRKLDGNVYRRNMDKLRLERQRSMRIEGGAAWATDRSVVADLRGFDGTDARVAFDDGTFGPWRPFVRQFGFKLVGKQGRRDVRLQVRSFRGVSTVPLRDDIKLDSVPPTVDGPRISLRRGARVQQAVARVPTVASMSASDRTSGLDTASLRATCDGTVRASKFATSGVASVPIQMDRRGCVLKARAGDTAGHRSTSRLEPAISLRDLRAGAQNVRFDRAWRTLRNGDAIGKTLARTAARGAQARVELEGSQIAVVARRGPAGGRFKVILDGKHVGTVDLYAATSDSRRVVWVRSVPKGKHVVKLRATGTGNPKSSGAIVWLDAVLTLDRRK